MKDQTDADRYWLFTITAPRRLSREYSDGLGLWQLDTRVFAWDCAAVEAVANRAAHDGIDVPTQHTRRGVPFVVLPSLWLLSLPVDDWGMSVPSLAYLRDVVAHHDARQITTPLEPGEGISTRVMGEPEPVRISDTAELGEEYAKWEL